LSFQTWEETIMTFRDLALIGGHGVRSCKPAGKRLKASPHNSLQVEWLEGRLVLDTVTFAQFSHLGGSPQVFAYTNKSGTSADFGTVAGGDAILLSVDTRFAPELTTPLTARLFLTAQTSAATFPPLPPDNTTREHFPVAANMIQVLLDTPVDGKTNFLTVTFSDLFGGVLGSHEASLTASDAASGMPPDMVTFTSDFINFTGTINHGISLSFSSVDSVDGSGGLQLGDGDFFKSFTAAGTGAFDTSFSGQIRGEKFQDTNGNGRKDLGEPGLAGWHIFLDGNGVHRETVTDANGNYTFADVNPGIYQVSEEARPGWVQTTVSPGAITVVSGSDITGIDFGNFQLGSIAGTKFQDSNGNGIRDVGEPGLAGWTIVLDAVGGSTHLSTVTDATGSYRFTDVPAGTYQVREVGQPGWAQTTGNPPDITVVSGSQITGIDFGNFQLGSIAGTKFQDSNGNGVRDVSEPGLAGWTIVLDAGGGSTPLTAVTDVTGSYLFSNLPAGTYRVQEVGQPGWVQTTVNPPDITVVSGSDITGVDFGNEMAPVTPPLIPGFPGTGPPPSPPAMVSKLELFAPNLFGIQNGLLAADSAYIGALYQSLLNRSVDDMGLAHWLQMLLADLTRGQVAMAIWQSPEHRGVEVDQFYTTFLGRSADAGGREFWVDAFLAGADEVDVIRGFLTSTEYQATHGTDVEFVNGLYAQVLGRLADAPGRAAWLEALQSGQSRGAVAQAFLTSTEADRRVVDEYYLLFLNRAADPAGEQQWISLLQSGQASFESVGESFLASDEYFTRAAMV
jgi:hypothetical protein